MKRTILYFMPALVLLAWMCFYSCTPDPVTVRMKQEKCLDSVIADHMRALDSLKAERIKLRDIK